MTDTPLIFDLVQLARLRRRVAAEAVQFDFLLRRVAEDFADRLDAIRRPFATALDLGAHHGVIGRALTGRSGISSVVSMEACPALLAQCSEPRIDADPATLPFAAASFDLVISGLSLQFVNDLPGTLVQVRRVLRPDGLFLGAMLGGTTLTELRQAFIAAEAEVDGGASPRVMPCADVRDLGALLQRAGFALPVVDADVVTVSYASPLHLMREVKAMGASNMLAARRRVPLKRATLLRATEIYAERFARADGRVNATFEILTLTGWSPHASQQQPLRPGSATTRLADALGVPEYQASDPFKRG